MALCTKNLEYVKAQHDVDHNAALNWAVQKKSPSWHVMKAAAFIRWIYFISKYEGQALFPIIFPFCALGKFMD